MKFIFVFFLSFFSLFSANSSKAAEKINFKFEEMLIPLTIDQLSNFDEVSINDSTEVIEWFKQNGFLKVFELSKYLNFPIFKEESLNRLVLRSWVGRKILSELSNTIMVPNDKDGIQVFNTIENLLEVKKEVSTLDILKALPSAEISLDVDNLISIISSWKDELEIQQNLILNLNALEKTNNYFSNKTYKYYPDFVKVSKKIYTPHRVEPLEIELWKDNKKISEKELIIFMPGLGGDINNFRWIGMELSRRGWPVLFIDHKGSNSQALLEVLEGSNSLPSSADFFLYRIKDLDTVIKAHKNGKFGLANNSYILMGHSLGALIAFLYEGNIPKENFETRCDSALKDFALTNLSKLLQCQLNEIPLPEINNVKNANGIIGFNSFGSLIWPKEKDSGIKMPVLLIGGTYDLITPLISEQFKLFLSTKSNPLNRFLIIEGASHFSPIRINYDYSEELESKDIFKINKSFIGSNPNAVQKLSLKVIVEFLENLENKKSIKITKNQRESNLNFHILDRKNLKEIINNLVFDSRV